MGLPFLCHPLFSAIASAVTASFDMGGILTQAYFRQDGADVHVSIGIDFARWQVHELPVDYSVGPKLRCRPEYVGRFLHYSGRNEGFIYNVTTASLVMHSLVLYDHAEPVACAPITPFNLPLFVASIVFKSGVYGKIVIVQWQSGENSAYTCVICGTVRVLLVV